MAPHDVSSMVSVGDRLAGKYRVEKILGTGGMGVVVAARHEQLNQVRAIKLMHSGALDDRHAVERFIREAQSVVKLRSEHIPEVHDFGRLESGAPYIVMELLHGEDLSSLLKRVGQLPISECIDYIMQACHALAEAHAVGIVHRDVKPGNLFLTKRSDGSACIKVLDFGISKDLSANSTEEELTRSNVVMGTLQYMAPEQMRSAKKVDVRADVYSLGAIMYKLLTGRAPFQSPQPTEIIFMTLDEKTLVRVPSELRAEIPPSLDTIILRCLERDPAKRFASAGELLVALRPFGPCTAPCDDDELTIIRVSEDLTSHTQATMKLPDMQCALADSDVHWIDPARSQRSSEPQTPPTRFTVLDYFPPDFYFRPPPVPECVPRSSSRPSYWGFRLPINAASVETMPPTEMPASWRKSSTQGRAWKSTIIDIAALGSRAKAATEGIGTTRIFGEMRSHQRLLIGAAAGTWVVIAVFIVALARTKSQSTAALSNNHAAIAANSVPTVSAAPAHPADPPIPATASQPVAPAVSAQPQPPVKQSPQKVRTTTPRVSSSSKRSPSRSAPPGHGRFPH